jgi:hypothetical protein
MVNIIIDNGTSKANVEKFKALIGKELLDYIFKVKIYCDNANDLPQHDCSLDKYPVIIYMEDELTFYMLSMTAGYNNDESNELLKLLKFLKFDFDKDLIIGEHNIVDLTLEKPTYKRNQI